MQRQPEYDCWAKMIQRCTNPNAVGYKHWGGRGITICDRWRTSFADFLSDMGPRPSRQHSIDRIDNDGDYAPDNCRWVTRLQQIRNRRNAKRITWNGRTMTLAEWSQVLGIPYDTLCMRLHRQWSIDRTFTEALGVGRSTTQRGTRKPGCGWFGPHKTSTTVKAVKTQDANRTANSGLCVLNP